MNVSTNHNFVKSLHMTFALDPYTRGPSNLHICHLFLPHLWYRHLEIEKWSPLCCARLLFTSWLMYPLFGTGPICNAIHPWNFLAIDFHYKTEMANLSRMYWNQLGVGGDLYTKVPFTIFLPTKFCTIVMFFLKRFFFFEKKIIRKELFWVMFTWCLFLVIVEK
jgi:hypothetical protein